ncbi:histidine kinase [Microbacterium arabinogalactanolyticum]|uniref:histidine kinase n=1 Tax=Microbacterium arabinogalactanolyticum TaxID=69365 RepID=UPI004044BD2C
MTTRTIWQAIMLPPWRMLSSRWPWVALAYVAVSAVLVVPTAVLLAVTLLLLPLWGVVWGMFERRRLRMLGGPRLASGHVRVPQEERPHWLGIRLAEPATWRETAALLIGLLFGAVGILALSAQAAVLIILIGLPLSARTQGADVHLFGDVVLTLDAGNWWLPMPLVLPALLLFGCLNVALAAAQGFVTRWLLAARSSEIDQRVAQLTRSRAAIVDAHERERRRIERDLHDGVQQELVAVAARLGLLELELDADDVPAARTALELAQRQTEGALATLRETVRGIRPAVLGDRGLGAAIEDLAARSVLPIRIVDRGFPRLDAAREAAAYFLVAEAASNAAKHSAATVLIVILTSGDGEVRVTVEDNGHGGADPAKGTGLRGLTDRAEAIGATLRIVSPAGGPTSLTLGIPCEAPTATEVDGAHPARR